MNNTQDAYHPSREKVALMNCSVIDIGIGHRDFSSYLTPTPFPDMHNPAMRVPCAKCLFDMQHESTH